MDELPAILREDFLLDHTYNIETDNPLVSAEAAGNANEAGVLVVYLRRTGHAWDDKEFTHIPGTKEVFAIVLGESQAQSRTVTMEAFPGSTIADFAQYIYSEVPSVRDRVLEDYLGLPYQLTDVLDHITTIPLLHIRINAVQVYTAEQKSHALQVIAALRGTTPELLAADTLSALN